MAKSTTKQQQPKADTVIEDESLVADQTKQQQPKAEVDEIVVEAPSMGNVNIIGETNDDDITHISVAVEAETLPSYQSGLVSIKIQYPENWKKEKHFKDGDIKELAKETADHFVEMGIATILKSK